MRGVLRLGAVKPVRLPSSAGSCTDQRAAVESECNASASNSLISMSKDGQSQGWSGGNRCIWVLAMPLVDPRVRTDNANFIIDAPFPEEMFKQPEKVPAPPLCKATG